MFVYAINFVPPDISKKWRGRTVQIGSGKCNFGIHLDIQAITTLLCLLLVLYVLVPSIHYFFYLTTALLKSDLFPALKSILLPQFSSYRHRTGFIVNRFGKSTHISMISNSVTHLRSYTNSAIAGNSAPISPVTPRDRRAERRRLRIERRYRRIEWRLFHDFSQCFKCFMMFY